MKIVWTSNAWEDLHLQNTDEKILRWINDLIKDIRRDPFKGLGKPEPLKHTLQGFWSRRITQEDRLVYRVPGKNATKQVEIIPLPLLAGRAFFTSPIGRGRRAKRLSLASAYALSLSFRGALKARTRNP